MNPDANPNSDRELERQALIQVWGRIPMRWRRRLAVAVGGAIGTGLRAAIAAVMPVTSWPWATFIENVSGSFLLGLLITRLMARGSPRTLTVSLLCTGVLGSYTTFSTFVVEAFRLSELGQPLAALAYAAFSVALGLASAWAGVWLGSKQR